MDTEAEDRFTVFIRLPFNRGSFVDPPPVAWSAAKEKELWEIISRQSKGNEIDWKKLTERFEVTQSFLLQQAAWLYERQLSQVRAQMRRMSTRQFTAASPVPQSTTASVVAAQPTKRGGSFSSRTPSRLSMQGIGITAGNEISSPATPIKSRNSLTGRSSTTTINTQAKTAAGHRTLSRKSSKDNEPTTSRTHSRRGSLQQQISKSPIELEPPEQSSSEDEIVSSKPIHRRSNPSAPQRRTPSLRKSQHNRQQSIGHVEEETEEEDSPAFLPFVDSERPNDNLNQDPSATLRGEPQQVPTQTSRPGLQHRPTSERIRQSNPATTAANAAKISASNQTRNISSSTSSNDGFQSAHPPQPPRHPNVPSYSTRRQSSRGTEPNLPTPLSPNQQAALAQAAGLSPRSPHRRPTHGHTGSESSPSMGSSFSDLDDASVTQSALEEALMSGMGSVANTPVGGAGTTFGGVGAIGSRMSGISQALRSRYFDTRGDGNTSNNSGNNTNNSGRGGNARQHESER